MLSELMVSIETIDGKLDQLLNRSIVDNLSFNGDVNEFIKAWNDATGRTRCMTNQEFDEEMK